MADSAYLYLLNLDEKYRERFRYAGTSGIFRPYREFQSCQEILFIQKFQWIILRELIAPAVPLHQVNHPEHQPAVLWHPARESEKALIPSRLRIIRIVSPVAAQILPIPILRPILRQDKRRMSKGLLTQP